MEGKVKLFIMSIFKQIFEKNSFINKSYINITRLEIQVNQ